MRFSGPLIALSAVLAPTLSAFPATAQAAATNTTTTIERAVDSGASCATFSGQRYCLGIGFTSMSERDARATRATLRTTPPGQRGVPVEQTGDLDTSPTAPRESAAQRRAEFREAAAGAAKAAALTADVTGSNLRTAAASYPSYKVILNPKRVAEQTRTYYCGPTSFQMIAWNWSGTRRTQDFWASRLGTTTGGTSINRMVSATNTYTGWDNADHAGKYIVLDIGNYTFTQWFTLMKKHIATYRAPVILHPVLKKRYYSYLDDDASGHFQVGRGYDTRGAYWRMTYFEPWNQQRFDPSEPFIARLQYHRAWNDFLANRAHPAHNIGL